MKNLDEKDLIYDWNKVAPRDIPEYKIELDDETLRDGLQSPSITDPTIEQKIELLHLMEDLQIDCADIGLPGAGPRAYNDVLELTREIASARMKIKPNIAARTVIQDITPAVEISQKTGVKLEVYTFLGSSPIRQYVEEWTLDSMLKKTEEAVKYTVENGLPNVFVTEDTTRAHPETIRRLYTTAIECGSKRVCLCDTVGHATPDGSKELVNFIKGVIKDTGEDIKIDWHGHRDRGLSVPNSIAAIRSGASRIHATGLGIGERVGNTPMDTLLVNLKMRGFVTNDVSKLREYCEKISEYCKVDIPRNYPVIGKDAFRTATGVHAAAIVKAKEKGHNWLADRVYSSVPAGDFGFEQIIEIGPMSGRSNIIYWLKQHLIEPKTAIVDKLYDCAKKSNSILTKDHILKHVNEILESEISGISNEEIG